MAFLQIVIFAGIFFKLNYLMGMMALRSQTLKPSVITWQGAQEEWLVKQRRLFTLHDLAFKGAQSVRKSRKDKRETLASTDLDKKE